MPGFSHKTVKLTGTSRVTIALAQAESIDALPGKSPLQMKGVLRTAGELVCAPESAWSNGAAFSGLAQVLDESNSTSGDRELELAYLPSLERLSLLTRIHAFEAALAPNGNQVNLKLGKALIEQIANEAQPRVMHVLTIGSFLLLAGDQRMRQISTLSVEHILALNE